MENFLNSLVDLCVSVGSKLILAGLILVIGTNMIVKKISPENSMF